MEVKLEWITPDAEQRLLRIARVSSPHQDSGDVGLIKFCLRKGHWSPFESVTMSVEVNTSRAIGRQILRHGKGFAFQELSQRYAEIVEFEPVHPRRQAKKNRQSSVDDLHPSVISWWEYTQKNVEGYALQRYQQALDKGIAKESARFLLPESAVTKFYMIGSARSWIHYLQLRTQEDTQYEHQEVAFAIWDIFKGEFPVIGETLSDDQENITSVMTAPRTIRDGEERKSSDDSSFSDALTT